MTSVIGIEQVIACLCQRKISLVDEIHQRDEADMALADLFGGSEIMLDLSKEFRSDGAWLIVTWWLETEMEQSQFEVPVEMLCPGNESVLIVMLS